eukprot:m51a1_g3510 hypothetical protein (235) ;mRNA; f:871570-872688
MGQGKSKHSDSHRRKRKSLQVSSDVVSSGADMRRASTDAQWSRRKADDLFSKYCGEDGVIGPDQVGKLCEDVGVSPEDVSVLVLSYHLNARAMGYFTRDEWLAGLQRLRVETLAQLRACVKGLAAQLDDAETFRKVFRFAFLWSRERDCKVIDLQTADGLLALLMDGRSCHATPFREFLKEQASYKGVNLDQWTSFLEFTQVVSKDYTGYDESGAWPVMLDEFVAWSRSKKGSE